jgi:MFS family permease
MDAPSHPLQISDYRRFWAARFASVIATIGMVVIIGYQLYDLARSDYGMSIGEAAFQLGLLGLAQFVPLFLLTPVAGVVADRFDRRLVGALSMGIDLVVALTLALATSLDLLSLPLLFVMAAMHGAARVFVGPAIGAIAPNIVPAALLPKAVALNSMAMQGGMILGLAALLVRGRAAGLRHCDDPHYPPPAAARRQPQGAPLRPGAGRSEVRLA